MKEERYQLKKDIAIRIKILHLVFTGVVIGFLVYIVGVILYNDTVAEAFQYVYSGYVRYVRTDRAHRGSIYSRNGEPLAVSVTRKTLRLDYSCETITKMEYGEFKQQASELASRLAAYFGDRTSAEYYAEIMKHYKRHNRSHRLFRDVEISEWNDIKRFPILCNGHGVTYSVEDSDGRVYPQGNLALRTIGRFEPHRSYGIELALRDTLAGHNGVQVWHAIAPGHLVRVKDSLNVEPRNGYDVVTTLDIDVQDVASNALAEQLVAQNAIWGTTIVMECATGDILAMANLKREGDSCVEVQNYAIGVPVNPGSTFKLVSAMALLEHGVPTSQRYHSGLGKRIEVGGAIGAKVQDSHAIAKETGGVIDMRRAFSESANVYFTKAVFERFGAKPVEFSDFCRKLHLHETVGLEKLGAQKKPLPHLDRRHHSRINALVNMAYGYGLEVTPLHTLALYNAVANNGRMVAPRLVLRTERDGEVVSEAPIRVIDEQICSKPTIDTLRSFMEEVSLTGTAAEYFGEKKCLFRTGAKTGTAQVDSEINGVRYRRGDGYYYGSMVTYLPADNPRYTIMTAIFTKRQTGKFYYGASLSGPVQKSVATFLYNRDIAYAEVIPSGEMRATEIKSGNIDKMRKVASEYGGKFTTESRHGWGECNTSQADGKLHISQVEIREDVVPNVVGMGLNDALYLLERCGLAVEVVGYGSVVKQSLAPNSEVAKTNRRIKIELQ